MDRYSLNEQINLIGKLPDNAINARIYIWKIDMTLVIDGEPVNQLILGTFFYNFVPMEEGYYIWQMKGTHPKTNREHTFEGNFLYGGWIDSLLKPAHLYLLAKEITSQTIKTETQAIKAKTDTLTPGQEVVFVSRGLTVESHSVTNFYLGESATMVAEVKFDTLPVSGATVTGDYYKPDNTVFLSNQAFTEIGTTGIYVHTFDIPTNADKGVYKVKIKATKTTGGGTNYSEDFTGFISADWGILAEHMPCMMKAHLKDMSIERRTTAALCMHFQQRAVTSQTLLTQQRFGWTPRFRGEPMQAVTMSG